MRYPDLLNANVSRVGLQESQRYNLVSGQLVADIVSTSLGPRGMEKMYIDILGEDTLTGHGGAFLRKIDVDHPAAKAVIEAVNTVDTHVGDGTTSAAVLIGALLKRAEGLLKRGIPTAAVVRGYEMGLNLALEALGEIEMASDRGDREVMRRLLATCLEGKAIFELQEEADVIGIIMDAVCSVACLKTGRIDVDDIKIEEKPGNAADLQLIRGTVIDKTLDGPAMTRDVQDAKILLVNEPLEPMRAKAESEIEITSPEQMGRFLGQEDADLLAAATSIADSGADIVISRKGVSELVQESLAKKGIVSMRRVKYNDLWWLEKATGARTCRDIENISPDELGFARRVYERNVGGDRMVFVEAGGSPKSVTLLLRAGSKRYLDEFHRNALNAFYVLRNFIENPRIVCGAGASEMIISRRIKEAAAAVAGREQIVIGGFADALEQIPLTLAQNIGMDVLDAGTLLRARHAAPGGGVRWYGVDSAARRISDMSSSGIIETSDVKRQVFKTAVEAANMILNVDDVFVKDIIDNTHCHIDGTVHAHRDGGKAHNHFEQEGLEQRQMHHYY